MYIYIYVYLYIHIYLYIDILKPNSELDSYQYSFKSSQLDLFTLCKEFSFGESLTKKYHFNIIYLFLVNFLDIFCEFFFFQDIGSIGIASFLISTNFYVKLK